MWSPSFSSSNCFANAFSIEPVKRRKSELTLKFPLKYKDVWHWLSVNFSTSNLLTNMLWWCTEDTWESLSCPYGWIWAVCGWEMVKTVRGTRGSHRKNHRRPSIERKNSCTSFYRRQIVVNTYTTCKANARLIPWNGAERRLLPFDGLATLWRSSQQTLCSSRFGIWSIFYMRSFLVESYAKI